MQFTEVQKHFDGLIVDEASHFTELEARLLFVIVGSNECPTIVLMGNPAEHPDIIRNAASAQKSGLDKVALLSTQLLRLSPFIPLTQL